MGTLEVGCSEAILIGAVGIADSRDGGRAEGLGVTVGSEVGIGVEVG